MRAWKWTSMELILSVHGHQIAEHGGLDGIRDRSALESALARLLLRFVSSTQRE